MTTVYTRPSLSGIMRESPDYRTLGMGFTDRIIILGHADDVEINDPYQVGSIQEAINVFGVDTSSPLFRGLIETYYAGARDIWLMPVAPMDEYVVGVSDRAVSGAGRGQMLWGEDTGELQIETFYEQANISRQSRGAALLTAPSEAEWDAFDYYERLKCRLDIAYELLLSWEIPQIVVPMHAPSNAPSVDFVSQLSTHCAEALDLVGSIRIGVINSEWDSDSFILDDFVDDLVANNRFATQGDNGKFVLAVAGEGVINLKEFPTSYSCPLATVVAGTIAHTPLYRGVLHLKLPNVLSLSTRELTDVQVVTLSEAKINPVIRTTLGRRGKPFECVLATDNTLGTTGTDYWSLGQVRLMMHTIDRIRALSTHYIGTIEYGQYKREVRDYLVNLVQQNIIRSFQLDIVRSTTDLTRVIVDVSITPFVGLRQLFFVTEVGPGA